MMGWLRKISNWCTPSYPPPYRPLPFYAEMEQKDPELLDAIAKGTAMMFNNLITENRL